MLSASSGELHINKECVVYKLCGVLYSTVTPLNGILGTARCPLLATVDEDDEESETGGVTL